MREEAASEVAGSFHVAIVGGGISGLSTAWYVERQAAAQGVPVVCSIYETAAGVFADSVIIALMQIKHCGIEDVIERYSNIQ